MTKPHTRMVMSLIHTTCNRCVKGKTSAFSYTYIPSHTRIICVLTPPYAYHQRALQKLDNLVIPYVYSPSIAVSFWTSYANHQRAVYGYGTGRKPYVYAPRSVPPYTYGLPPFAYGLSAIEEPYFVRESRSSQEQSQNLHNNVENATVHPATTAQCYYQHTHMQLQNYQTKYISINLQTNTYIKSYEGKELSPPSHA